MSNPSSLLLKNVLSSVCLLVLLWLSSCASTGPALGEKGYTEKGKASYYSNKFRGKKMANGERYSPGKKTAAHKKLAFGTKVRVTNPENGKSVKVRITDRGPFTPGRILDLSLKAARQLDLEKAGVAKVEMEVIKPAKKK